jgi:hypothetical protein
MINSPETPQTPEALLHELNSIAPLSEESADSLKDRGMRNFILIGSQRQAET